MAHNAAPVIVISFAWLFGSGSVEFAGIGATLCALGASIGYKLFANKRKAPNFDIKVKDTTGQTETVACAGGGGNPDPNDPHGDKNKNNFPHKKPDEKAEKDKTPDKQQSTKQNTKNLSEAEKFRKAVEYATTETKLIHFFNNKSHDHGFSKLLNKLGGIKNIDAQKKLIKKIIRKLMKSGQLPKTGKFENIAVDIAGYAITVKGFIHDGIIKIGTMFIPF